VLRIIALADTQKNIAVKKTGIAPPPSIMILIETFAGECVIRQERDLVGKLGKLASVRSSWSDVSFSASPICTASSSKAAA